MIPYGGGKRTRTADLLVANQLLSQLSYAPRCSAAQSFLFESGLSIPFPAEALAKDGGPSWI